MENKTTQQNRKARRAAKKHSAKKGERVMRTPSKQEMKEARKYKQDMSAEAVEKRNIFRDMLAKVKKSKEHFELPETVSTTRYPKITRVKVINKDGRYRELLPDVPGQHKILCHKSVAKVITSGACIIVQITKSKDGSPQDGSWAICPEAVAMANTTTVQFVRRRSWWWLRRYSYEISFDGRIQPAGLFWAYGLNPEIEEQSFYLTHETVTVKSTGELNHYFRFWLNKPEK